MAKNEIWGAQWNSKNLLDGERSYLLHENLLPVMFKTKYKCNEWIKNKYGYIAKRKDLRAEPHGWRMPKPVKLDIKIK